MPESLTELWAQIERILQYKLFELKQTPITVSSIFVFGISLVLLFVFSRLFEKLVVRRLFRRFQLDEGLQYNLSRISHYVIMILGAIVAFQFIGIDLGALAVIFGLLSVGIGFGLQNVTSNFVAGLILLFERPIKVGDRVTIGDIEGDVTAINMRSSTVRSVRNISVIVPNSDFIATRVINWSHGDPTIRLDLEVGVAYGSDLDLVLKTLREVAERNPSVLRDPPPRVLFTGFGDSAWNLKLLAWVPDPFSHHQIQSDIFCEIVHKFREHGIEIPFPQRDLHVRSPLPVPLSQTAGAS